MNNKRYSRSSKSRKLLLITGIVVLSILGFATYKYLLKESDNTIEYSLPTGDDKVKIEVFNGCRDMKVTLEIVELLRKSGEVDVLDIAKTPGYVYPHSILLDRKGNKELMKNLAGYLSLSDERVLLQRSNQFLDATLVIGIDNADLLSTLRERLKR